MWNRLGPPWVPLDQGLTENSDRNSAIFFAVCFLLQINWSNEMVFKHITYKNGFAICTIIVVMLTLKMYTGDFTFPWKNITLSTEHQSPSVHEILNSFSLINKDASGNSSMMDEFIARHFIFSQSSLYSLNESEIGRLLKGASNATDPQTVSIWGYIYRFCITIPMQCIISLAIITLHVLLAWFAINVKNNTHIISYMSEIFSLSKLAHNVTAGLKVG